MKDHLVDIAIELQSIAQAGLEYSKDKFDIERFQRIREISAEIMSKKSELSLDKVKDLFCNETGYQTSKVDTRAAIFKNNKILLVKEISDEKWTLPGGWLDVNKSIKENIIKEVFEEAALNIKAEKLIGIHDRNKHNLPPFAYGVCKIFILCSIINGEFSPNIEISDCRYFALNEIPELSVSRTSQEQIKMCFDAYNSPNWEVVYD